jgi:DNA-binding PadR family transcriptional regulator
MLKENEKRMLDVLKKLSDDGVVQTSAKNIPIKFEKTKRVFEKVEFIPSKEAKLNALKRLEKKGYIELDYSKQTEPKITIKKYEK